MFGGLLAYQSLSNAQGISQRLHEGGREGLGRCQDTRPGHRELSAAGETQDPPRRWMKLPVLLGRG